VSECVCPGNKAVTRNMDGSLFSSQLPVIIHTSSTRYGRYLQSLVGQLGLEATLADSVEAAADSGGISRTGLVVVDNQEGSRSTSHFFASKGVPALYLTNSGSGPLPEIRGKQRVLKKPLDPSEFVSTVEMLYHRPQQRPPQSLAEPYLIGNSPRIKEIRKDIKKICNTDMTVLLLGGTGAGKGILARSLHNNSVRGNNPFVEVNCANIPHSLMESEFFGHKRGAFTGAWRDKTGKFELASKGTIFLDEISEMSWNTQAKLLQVLQESEFSPLGGMDNVQVNVRVIAATNIEPERLVSSGEFRLDLYYRLAVLRFYLPSLRERKEDIPPLSMFFLEKYARQYDKHFTTPTPRLWKMLEDHDWPGNVRELENTIRTLVALENEDFVIEEMAKKMQGRNNPGLAAPAEQRWSGKDTRAMTLREITEREIAYAEKEVINKVLQKTNGNKKKAAELLKVSYKSMLMKAKAYGL